MALLHRFLATEDHNKWSMSVRVDGAEPRPRVELSRSHMWLASPRSVLDAVHAGVARVLRWTGRALLFSPLLVLPQLLFNAVAPAVASGLVVAFVCTVVAFFATLNVFILVAIARFVRAGHVTLRLWGHEAEDVAEARESLFQDQILAERVRGHVLSIGAPDDEGVVIREVMSRALGVRLLEASDFALETDEGEVAVVRLTSPPLFLGQVTDLSALAIPAETRSQLAERGLVNLERSPGVQVRVLRTGDYVEVIGVETAPIARTDRFELGGATRGIAPSASEQAPYRGARGDSARLLQCAPTMPMVLCTEARS